MWEYCLDGASIHLPSSKIWNFFLKKINFIISFSGLKSPSHWLPCIWHQNGFTSWIVSQTKNPSSSSSPVEQTCSFVFWDLKKKSMVASWAHYRLNLKVCWSCSWKVNIFKVELKIICAHLDKQTPDWTALHLILTGDCLIFGREGNFHQ